MGSQHRGASPDGFGQSLAANTTGTSSLSRRVMLRTGGAGIAGMAVFGVALPKQALASTNPSSDLEAEFDKAAEKYEVPKDLLMAMGYVNTRLEMPPPRASDYQRGEPHSRGTYGIMALVRNPSGDTLGRAAELTGFSAERLKTDRAANIMGGAAILSHSQGDDRPDDATRWLGAVHGKGGRGERYAAAAGVGAGELYAGQVNDALKQGFSVQVSSGERISLRGKGAR